MLVPTVVVVHESVCTVINYIYGAKAEATSTIAGWAGFKLYMHSRCLSVFFIKDLSPKKKHCCTTPDYTTTCRSTILLSWKACGSGPFESLLLSR